MASEQTLTTTSEQSSISEKALRGELATVPPKENSLDAWLTVLGGCLAAMASLGLVTSFGVFQAYYCENTLLGHTNDDVAWIGSVQLWGTFFFAMPAGRLLDGHGIHVSLFLQMISQHTLTPIEKGPAWYRHLLHRLWQHDGLHLQEILPVCSIAGPLCRHRLRLHLHACRERSPAVVYR